MFLETPELLAEYIADLLEIDSNKRSLFVYDMTERIIASVENLNTIELFKVSNEKKTITIEK